MTRSRAAYFKMANDGGVAVVKKQYFFGMAKFLSFSNDDKTLEHTQRSLTSPNIKNAASYTTPIWIKSAQNLDKTCVTWSGVFHLCKGKVSAHGWCNGRKIPENENVVLPVDDKIINFQAGWNKIVLISAQGKCHIMANLHNDWSSSLLENETKFTNCGVGDLHTILLDETGGVYEVKLNKFSLCSSIHLKVAIDEVSCGKEHVLLLNKTSGHIFSFGLGSRGQLGHGDINADTTPKLIEALAGIRIKQVEAGGWHSLALSDIGDIYAWGWNDCGQLGITCLPPEVPCPFYTLPYIVEFPLECIVHRIACGARHSGAVTSKPKQSILTWGWGAYGQLGHGDSQDRSTPFVVEYFEDINTEILDITCGPWQTVVTLVVSTALRN